MLKTHKDLTVWQDARKLVREVYMVTKLFPKEELHCLTAQIRRCAISIPSNISEGAARSGKKEFIRFLYIALGSVSELKTQILLSKDLGYPGEIDSLLFKIDKIGKMISGLINALSKQMETHPPNH